MTDSAAMPFHNSAVALPNLDRIIRGLLYAFVFSLPFKDLLFLERNGFIILIILLVIWCAVHRSHFFLRTPLDLPLAAFATWVGVMIPFAAFPDYSLKEFGKLLQQGLLFYVVLFFFQGKARWTQLIWVLIGTSCIVSLYGIMQFDPMNFLAVKSFLPAEVWLVTYLVMLIPLAFALAWYEQRPWMKGLYGLVTLLLTCCLLLTQSRAGLISFLVELIACVWLVRRKAMVALAGTVIVVLIIGAMYLVKIVKADDGTFRLVPRIIMSLKTSTHSVDHRLDLWAYAAAQIAEHPIVGIGYGKETSRMLFEQIPKENIQMEDSRVRKHGTHNIILELAVLVGIPGMGLFLWLGMRILRTLVEGFRHAGEAYAKATLLGLCVSTIGLATRIQFDQMLVGTLAIQFWVMMAIGVLASSAHGATTATEEPA